MKHIDRWLIPALFVTVASLQFTLANTDTLSPWKGGGFGMFAVVDSPAMRVVSATGYDTNGDVLPIDPTSALSAKEHRNLRSYPQRKHLKALASELVDSEFVATTTTIRTAYERVLDENPDIFPHDDELKTPAVTIYRQRKPDDPLLPSDQIRRIEWIELRLWRLRFDPEAVRIWCEQLLDPIHEIRHGL